MRLIGVFFSLLCALFFYITAYSQYSMSIITNKYFYNSQRVSSIFYHDNHNEKAEIEDCEECHHVYDVKTNKLKDDLSEYYFCSSCHLQEIEKYKVNLRKAFHITCKSCHTKRKKGPYSCGHCHIN